MPADAGRLLDKEFHYTICRHISFVRNYERTITSYLFTYLPGLKNLSSGWVVIIITISVSLIAAILFPVEEKEAMEDEL